VILTGTGHEFLTVHSPTTSWPRTAEDWDKKYWEGKELLVNLLNIEVPVIGAVNGPALSHAELVLLSDIVIATEDTVFGDHVHMLRDLTPGDGTHVLWPLWLGVNRGRQFLLMGDTLSVKEAHELGIVQQVVPRDELMPRAREIASQLVTRPRLSLRYTRVCTTMMLKRLIHDNLGYGLALEGLAMMDMMARKDSPTNAAT
jgi:enoyl-CoA hydratase/carnithine racemase